MYDDQELLLSTLPAATTQRRLAFMVVFISTAFFLAALPFAKSPLAEVPAFIPAYEAALFVCDLITALLMFGQYHIRPSRSMLALACAYLFSALMACLHALSFPGLFSTGGLPGTGSQTTAWLYYLWHCGFPLALIASARLEAREHVKSPQPGRPSNEALVWVAATVAASAALAVLTTAGHDALPVIISENRYVAPTSYIVSIATCLLTAAALPVLWRRPRTVLNVWLMVVICAWVYDIALAAIFNGGRFTLGWYAGRVYGLLAASLVLFVLLLENGSLYGKLAIAHRRHLRQLKLLYEIDMAVTSYQSHAAVAAAVVQPLRELVETRYAALGMIHRQEEEIEWVAAALDGERLLPRLHHSMMRGFDMAALQRGEICTLHTFDLPDSELRQSLLEAGITTQVLVPKIAGHELAGVVALGGQSLIEQEEALRIAREVAVQLAIAISQSELYAKLSLQAEELATQAEELESQAEDLTRSESRLRGILESAMDAIITVDHEERIVIFNAAAEEIFGCPRGEALNSHLSRFIPERFRAGHSAHIARFGQTGGSSASRRMSAMRVVTGLRANGEEFPIDASISHHASSEGRFYTVILRDVTERIRAEEALKRSRDELHELAAAASSAREQEKSRVARELHDELAQGLTALKMDLNWLRERLPPERAELVQKTAQMRAMVDSAITSTRRISADLRPLVLDDLGLVPAAEWLVQNFKQRTGIECQLTVEPPELDLQDPHATAVFRILQESLNNIWKHAKATSVLVRLAARDARLVLTVSDNGCGFVTSAPRKPGSLGLAGQRERAYLIYGEIHIDSAPGQGTTVSLNIPLSA